MESVDSEASRPAFSEEARPSEIGMVEETKMGSTQLVEELSKVGWAMSLRSLWLSRLAISGGMTGHWIGDKIRGWPGLAWAGLRGVGTRGNLGRNGRHCGGRFWGWEQEETRMEGRHDKGRVWWGQERQEEGGAGRDG